MNYLTIDEIKEQLIIDKDFTDDDNLLNRLGLTAEQLVQDHMDGRLDEIVGENGGELPETLRQAMLMIVDYLYDYRGSDENKPVPDAFFILCRPYIRYTIR